MSTTYTGHEVLEIMEEAANYNAMIFDLIKSYGRGSKWLDFGAGNGHFAKRCASFATDLHCVENDASLRTTLAAQGFHVATDIDHLTTTYDTIYSINVLEHVIDDQVLTKKLIQRLNPGGRLLIYTPAFPILYSALDKKIGHQRRYTRESLVPLFKELQTLQCNYVDSLGFFASFYLKLFAQPDKPLSADAVRFYDRWLFPLSQQLDRLSHPYFGKNIFYVGEKAP